MEKLFYRPERAVLGDVIPFYDHGEFKPFYLRNFRCNRDAGHRDGWVMLTTKDHLHYDEHDTGIVGGTGSVIYTGGMYHMFYCTFQQSPERNYIEHATSPDLDVWTTIPEDRFASDDEIYAPVHWRDPFVFWVEEEQCWWMILAAQKKGPTTRRGCVGLCKSSDLHHWTYAQPLYAPMNAQCAFECPDLFRWGDWYYLVFSSYADRFQTLYRMSRSLHGPWLTPEIDTFDTRAFYAAKTGTDGQRRLIYGWNPTRELDDHHFDPRAPHTQDWNGWDWGGNLVVHELFQQPDGTLRVAPMPEVLQAVSRKESLRLSPLCGAWDCRGDCAEADAKDGYASLLLNPMEGTCRLSMDVILLAPTAQLGVAMHVDERFAEGYYAIVDPFRKRLEFKSPIRMTERGGQAFPYEVEQERPVPRALGERFHLDVVVDGSILEVYLDRRVVLGTRMLAAKDGCWGLFASEGQVRFEHIACFRS